MSDEKSFTYLFSMNAHGINDHQERYIVETTEVYAWADPSDVFYRVLKSTEEKTEVIAGPAKLMGIDKEFEEATGLEKSYLHNWVADKLVKLRQAGIDTTGAIE